MEITIEKTNTMLITTRETKHSIEIEWKVLEQVKNCSYLGIIIKSGTVDGKINKKLGKTGRIYKALRSIKVYRRWWGQP